MTLRQTGSVSPVEGVQGRGSAQTEFRPDIEGLRAVAAPIRDRSGRVVGAVNVSTHAGRTSLESLRRNLIPPLLRAAARISADLPAAATRLRPVADTSSIS